MLPVRKPRFSASDLILGLKQSVTGSVHLLCFNKTRKSIPSTELSHKECPVHLASRRNHSWAGPSTQTPPPLPTIPGSDTKPFLSRKGLPWGFSGKESTCQCRRQEFDPWVGKTPGGGRGSPLQSSCLENPMDRGAWRATVHRVAELGRTERLNTFAEGPFKVRSKPLSVCQALESSLGLLSGPLAQVYVKRLRGRCGFGVPESTPWAPSCPSSLGVRDRGWWGAWMGPGGRRPSARGDALRIQGV